MASGIKVTKSIFSHMMDNLVINVGTDQSSPIVIHSDTFSTIVFTLNAIDSNICITTSDIVQNFKRDYDPAIARVGLVVYPLDKIHIQVRNESGEYTANSYLIPTIFGGYDRHRVEDEYDFIQHNFLTWRPQICYTSPGVKEQLSFVIHNEGADASVTYPTTSSRKIFAKIYFRTHQAAVLGLEVANQDLTLYRVDCSYDRIATIAGMLQIDDEVVAYDIYGGIDENTDDSVVINPQRFIVRPRSSSHTHFFFQNTLGGFDTITATGEVVSSAKGDVQTSMVRRKETEVHNAYVKSWEVNTGYIVTAQEENLWHEFLRSTNRYILLENGTYRKIIVEEYKAERATMEADSFTFKFHYAEAAEGSGFNKAESLPEFYIG
ncbi:MAG: hypothetical protein J6U95_01125 [Alistipes sp.]|nr:hypothetical protein [Alistipes sp.]